MDPNETLRLLRLTIAQMQVEPKNALWMAHAEEVIEYAEALDTWLSSGGFKPLAWENFGGLKTPEQGAYPENTHREDMKPDDALRECYDLWASGAWPDSNAEPNLEEVMDHVKRLLDAAEPRR
jgi:hypothetical protein